MVTDEMLAFVRAHKKAGTVVQEIERLLTAEGGCEHADVEEALRVLGDSAQGTLPSTTTAPEAKKPEQITATKQTDPVTTSETPAQALQRPPQQTGASSAGGDFLGMFDGGKKRPFTVLSSAPVQLKPAQPKEPVHPKAPPPLASHNAQAPQQKAPNAAPEVSLEELLKHVSAPLEELREERPAILPGGIKLNLSVLNDSKQALPQPKETLGSVSAPPAAGSASQTPRALPKEPALFSLSGVEGSKVEGPALSKVEGPRPTMPIVARRTMQADMLSSGTPLKQQALVAKTPESAPNKTEEPVLSKAEGPARIPPKASAPTVTKELHPEEQPASVLAKSPAPLAKPQKTKSELIARKNRWERSLALLAGVVLLLGALTGAMWALLLLVSPSEDVLFAGSVNNFFKLSSFSYQGEGAADLALVARDENGQEKTGTVKFNTTYSGAIENGEEGFENGEHALKFAGGLATGNF